MIDWLGWLKRLEFTTIGALAIAGLALLIGQSAERYADANTTAAARLAAQEAPADGGAGVRFRGVDYSTTGAIKSRIGAASPCKVDD